MAGYEKSNNSIDKAKLFFSQFSYENLSVLLEYPEASLKIAPQRDKQRLRDHFHAKFRYIFHMYNDT